MPLIQGGRAVVLKIVREEPTYILAKIFTVKRNAPIKIGKYSVDFVGTVLFYRKNREVLSVGDTVIIDKFYVKNACKKDEEKEYNIAFFFSVTDWKTCKRKHKKSYTRKFDKHNPTQQEQIPRYTGSSFSQGISSVTEVSDIDGYDFDDDEED